jgi:hypothetical protein
MTGNPFVSNGDRFIGFKELKGGHDILHLFLYCVMPKGCVRLLINLQGFINGLRHPDTKLMRPFPVPTLNGANDSVLASQNVFNPPNKSRFFHQLVVYRILGNLNWV